MKERNHHPDVIIQHPILTGGDEGYGLWSDVQRAEVSPIQNGVMKDSTFSGESVLYKAKPRSASREPREILFELTE